MLATQPELPQWTELGEQLSGPNSSQVRSTLLDNLLSLERRAETELRLPKADAPRILALLEAVQAAKKLANTLFKPLDLSTL